MKRFAIVVALALTLTGCKDAYGTAAKLYQDVSVTIGQASTTVNQFQIDGTVTVAENRTIQGYLLSLNSINGTYASCVKVAHASTTAVGGFTACANTLNKAMSDPAMLATLHISNAKAQGELQGVSQTITTLVTTTLTALNGK
jgi:hypothetical protein